jgi:anti-anti-sigma factor
MCAVDVSELQPFSIAVVPDRDEVAVVLEGDLDLASADTLEREVKELRAAGFERVVVDLRQVGFIDSSGLRVLLGLRSDASRDGHTLALVPGPRGAQPIFDLTATRGAFAWRES